MVTVLRGLAGDMAWECANGALRARRNEDGIIAISLSSIIPEQPSRSGTRPKRLFSDMPQTFTINPSDLDFELPADLISQEPSQKRDDARLLVVNRQTQGFEH